MGQWLMDVVCSKPDRCEKSLDSEMHKPVRLLDEDEHEFPGFVQDSTIETETLDDPSSGTSFTSGRNFLK